MAPLFSSHGQARDYARDCLCKDADEIKPRRDFDPD
jgi:hypothetical protein